MKPINQIKKASILFLVILYSFSALGQGQDITGRWSGSLEVQGVKKLKIVFNVKKSGKAYSATMDSPDQEVKGIPVTNVTFNSPKIIFEIISVGIVYKGDLKDSKIVGFFSQNGQDFPLNLSRKEIRKEIKKRPQEPSKPFPYHSEEVTFPNPKANISLSGTLTIPKKEGIFPVVILISGSGPQNRDAEVFGHKPFLVISDYLTRKGIGVLRYDERGVGKSEGNYQGATSADLSTDVEAAIAYLKTRQEVNKKNIGLIGHSEGGLIAPMLASKSKDINFIVLLAGPGVKGKRLMLKQKELLETALGFPASEVHKRIKIFTKLYDLMIKSTNPKQLKKDVETALRKTTPENLIKSQVDMLLSPWFQYFIKSDPSNALEKVKCPVLALNGEKDLQVDAKENLEGIKKSSQKGGNNQVTIEKLPNLNHLFQECKTGLPNEYVTIEQTFSPIALKKISDWILYQVE